MKSIRNTYGLLYIVGFTCLIIFFLGAHVVFGANPQYVPLVGIPGLTNTGISSLPDFINKVYVLVIALGTTFGVLKIAFAGVKYSLTDVISSKQSAKEDIKGVLLGLAILLLPNIVLYTINPNLIKLNILQNVGTKVQLNQSSLPVRQQSGGSQGGASSATGNSVPTGTTVQSTQGSQSASQNSGTGNTAQSSQGSGTGVSVPIQGGTLGNIAPIGNITVGGNVSGMTQLSRCGSGFCSTPANCLSGGGTNWIPSDPSDPMAGGSCYK